MRVWWILFLFVSLFGGCDNTDLNLAADAGLDAIKAVTLSDEDVKAMAVSASLKADRQHRIAPVGSSYDRRLYKLTGGTFNTDGYTFNFKVYQTDQINAFAMADGTIRIYSGLMDMLSDDELLFVVGHEMGHVVKKHIKKKIMLAYAASAVRKGVASQEGAAGEIARSGLGSFFQLLLNAQFSQEEERQADDWGIKYLQDKGRSTHAAVTALEKLAGLGKDHSFLSSHPDPGTRARRLNEQVASPEKVGQPTRFERIVGSIKKTVTDFFKN